jgi:tripartite-type tricarboxylate transporter receptor subunit TctC
MRGTAVLAFAATLLSAIPAASAQNYPVRPITLIVPFPPGGGVDAVGRIVADKLATALGQPVVIENRAGAAGAIGTRIAVKAAPDGYTLAMANTGTMAINPNLYANPGYEPRKDITPIGLISTTPIVMMAHPSFGGRTLSDVIAIARRDPGKLNIGTALPGTSANLAAEFLRSLVAIDFTIVTYKGTGPLTTDILGGHVQLALNTPAPAMPHLKAGTLRGIAVLAEKRSSLLPDVPTAAESGLPHFLAALNYGLVAPAGTPRPIVERLNRELRALLESADVRARIAADGGDPLMSSPAEYAADIEREDKKWGALIKKLNLKVE